MPTRRARFLSHFQPDAGAFNRAQQHQLGCSQIYAQSVGTSSDQSQTQKEGLNTAPSRRPFSGRKIGTTQNNAAQCAFRLLDPFF